MAINSLNSVPQKNKQEKKSLSVAQWGSLGATAGFATDLALGATATREKQLLNDVENITKNIKDTMPNADEFKKNSEILSDSLKQTIENRKNVPVLKKIGNALLSLIAFGDGNPIDYTEVGDFTKKLGSVGDINEAKKHINESGYKSLEKVFKLGKQFEKASPIKGVLLNVMHSYKTTGILGIAGLGVGIVLKLLDKDAKDGN